MTAIIGNWHWLREGREQGRQQAFQVHLLLRLLEKRFGPQPVSVRDRLEGASIEQLDVWILRLVDATSVEEILQTAPTSQ